MTSHEPSTIVLSIWGPIQRSDLPGLFKRVCLLLESSNARVALCDVSDADADAVTVDALARLQLAAGRNDCQVRLRQASAELRTLIELMGLHNVLVTED